MIEPLKEKAQDVKEQSITMANTTIKSLASVAWWMFVLAMLSFLATVGGGALGIADDLPWTLKGQPSSERPTLACSEGDNVSQRDCPSLQKDHVGAQYY